jgi:hypothetical protein
MSLLLSRKREIHANPVGNSFGFADGFLEINSFSIGGVAEASVEARY